MTGELLNPVQERLMLGCDFSSAPSRRKPIVVAQGQLSGYQESGKNPDEPASMGRLTLLKLNQFESLEAFGAWL